MPQTYPVKYVTDKDGNRVLPITHVNAVRDSEGHTLPELLGSKAMVYATCTTAADTAAKTVTAEDYVLSGNIALVVTFTNGISVAGATLAVTSDGETTAAIPVYYRGSALGADMVKAGASVMLRYNGTQFEVIGDLFPEVEAAFVGTSLVFTKGGEFIGTTLVLD